MSKSKAWVFPIIIGLILVVAGFAIELPGGALTTYKSLNGKETTNYVFDSTYTTIDEYVGGDAYNYIIGASLVAGKIAGTMTTKAICVVGGLLCIAFGMALMMMPQKETPVQYAIPSTTSNVVNPVE